MNHTGQVEAPREPGARTQMQDILDQIGKTHSIVGEIEAHLQEAGFLQVPPPTENKLGAPPPPPGVPGQIQEALRIIRALQERLVPIMTATKRIAD